MESIKVVVVTRFGIGMKDKAWYDYRYIVHKAFGQGCMLNQTNQNFEWVICLDESPPEDFLRKLKNDFKNSKNIHLLHIRRNWIDEYRDFINENLLTEETEKLVLARRDDDDGVSVEYIQNIYDFLGSNDVKLDFVPEKHSDDDGELVARFRPLRSPFNYWGKSIYEYFKDSPDILKYIFYGRLSTVSKSLYSEMRIYYKNTFVCDVGRICKYGKEDAQLQKLGELVDSLRDSEFVPYAYINHHTRGFVFNRGRQQEFRKATAAHSGSCYSILPVKNKRLTAFQDCIYENSGYGHNTLSLCGLHVVFNEITIPAQFMCARTQINDCVFGMKPDADSQPQSLNNYFKKTFGITDEGWNLYLSTTVATGYVYPKCSVNKTLRALKTRPDKEPEC